MNAVPGIGRDASDDELAASIDALQPDLVLVEMPAEITADTASESTSSLTAPTAFIRSMKSERMLSCGTYAKPCVARMMRLRPSRSIRYSERASGRSYTAESTYR